MGNDEENGWGFLTESMGVRNAPSLEVRSPHPTDFTEFPRRKPMQVHSSPKATQSMAMKERKGPTPPSRAPKAERQRFRLVLEDEPQAANGAPVAVRLRMALKRLLRGHGLRCVAIVPERQNTPMEPTP